MKKEEKLLKNKRARNPNNSKRRGNSYERKIAKELRDLGFDGIKTSREVSKILDDSKIDLCDINGQLPCNIQIKLTQKTPDYFGIENECPIKDKPFVIIWNKTTPTESTFRSVGEVAIIDKDFFYKLIKKYGEV